VNWHAFLTVLTFPTFLPACSPDKPQAVADWRRVPVSIELRVAEHSSGAGLVPAAVHGQGKTVYLHPETGLSNTHIARVEAIKSRIGQGLILEVWLTSAGARRIADLTGRHIGDGLAIMINSVVVAVPTIQDTLNPGTRMPFKVGVPLGPKESGQLEHAISQTWRPVPRKVAR
jgi:preprotein translocase subunit SecD